MKDQKKNFDYFLNKFEEVGYVEEIIDSIVYAKGLPGAVSDELVIFDGNQMGQVIGMDEEKLEILLFTDNVIKVGSKIARTGGPPTVLVDDNVLGKVLSPLGKVIGSLDGKNEKQDGNAKERQIDAPPIHIMKRKSIKDPLETGVLIVDLTVPLAKGQRELVIGDRNTGKTSFVRQTVVNQARKGTVCVYAAIGKKKVAIERIKEFLKKSGVSENVCLIAASASMPSGLNFITPYTAMAVAEHFRDEGRDVLVVMDELTSHAKFYREISLLARRFPGRNSYPGDIFYVHSRLLERAGSFEKASITCIPVAETVMGDLSGYIQTNLMAITDGHIFFDKEIFDGGKFPAVNQFLSVTRVGLQVQPDLFKDISRILSNFSVKLNQTRQYMHFGSELGKEVKKMLAHGTRLDEFLDQESSTLIPSKIGAFLLGALWGGFWVNDKPAKLKMDTINMVNLYGSDATYKGNVEGLVDASKTLKELVDKIRLNDSLFVRTKESTNGTK